MRPKTVLSFIHIYLIVLLVGVASMYGYGQGTVTGDTIKNIAKPSDTDSVKVFDLEKMKAESDLKAPIDYQSENYMILDLSSKTLKLVEKGTVKYEDMSLAADTVMMNWEKSVLRAKGRLDSTGQFTGRPEFTENNQTYRADSMEYQMVTQKGLVYGARTKQDENYILADRVKKVDGDTYYIEGAKFTTCDEEHPHYYIKSSRMKVLPQDKIVTGPLSLVLEDFPLPIIVPFGFFPNQTGRKSGLVMPQYGDGGERGFFLRNLGYYWAINDNIDFQLEGDIFTRGGFRLEANSFYKKRYRYDGNWSLEYGRNRLGERLDPQFEVTTAFWVRWNHNQTINPQASFRADVNAGSTGYNRNFSYNETNYLSSNFQSSINYNQSIANTAWRFNLNMSHNQNTQTEQVTLDAPNLTVTRSRYFPFKKPGSAGNKWYEKLGLSYTANLKNQLQVPDSLFADVLFNPNSMVTLNSIEDEDTVTTTRLGGRYFNNGLLQSIPINTQLSLLNYININPSFNYNEYWYYQTTEKRYWEAGEQVVEEGVFGFETARDFTTGVQATTRVYGVFLFDKLFKFWDNPREAAVRHTMTPTLGYSYKPDFSAPVWGYYETIQADTAGNTLTYSRFEDGVFGGPSAGENQLITFNVNNIFELKYKPKIDESDTTTQVDTKDPYKRLNILDQLQFNTSYNFAADSLNLSIASFAARTNILNNRFNIQLNGRLDPYDVDLVTRRRVNQFMWETERQPWRMTQLGVALTTRFQSRRRTGQSVIANDVNEKPLGMTDDEWDHIRYFRDAYVDFAIPWTLNLTGNFNYSNNGFTQDTTIILNFNGDFNLSPKWKIGATSGFDFLANDFSYTSISIYRDLHCWEMSMTWIPFGDRKSYNFSINVKSSTLRDLKLTKRNDWQDRF